MARPAKAKTRRKRSTQTGSTAKRKTKKATIATKKRKLTTRRARGEKVGDSVRAARKVGGKGDFGISEKKLRPNEIPAHRDILEELRHRPGVGGRDIDERPPRAGTESREAGVGGREAGPGSYSGGDVDPEFTGVIDATIEMRRDGNSSE